MSGPTASFGEQLRWYRERAGLTQEVLAEQAGLTVSGISALERGVRRRPYPYTVQALAVALALSEDERGAFTTAVRRVGATAEMTPVEAGDLPGSPPSALHPSERRILDWGDAPDQMTMHGRETELQRLTEWIVDDGCRLAAVLGMGGLGKTTLAATLARSVADQFDVVIWRSLLNAPPLTEVLGTWLQILSDQPPGRPPSSPDQALDLLFGYLGDRRCLLVLDNVESILAEGAQAGSYLARYEDYGRLIRRTAESRHQSCLLLTSRERPWEFTRLEGGGGLVCSLWLAGLTGEAGMAMLRERGLTDTAGRAVELVARYSGNPLALKLVAETIQDLFAGDIAAFLQDDEETPIFADIRDVLDQHVARLSPAELEILTWLAIEREAVSSQTLWENLVRPGAKRDFLEALRALRQRGLLERRGDHFTLPNVVIEYATEQLITDVCQEIELGRPERMVRHALLRAQAKEYVRQSQARLLLQPIAERLTATLGREALETRLRSILDGLRAEASRAPGYAAGNILKLVLGLGYDPRGYDFSRLTVWQADLRGIEAPQVDFTEADLARSVFTDTFGAIKSLGFSPNGHVLAAGTADGEVRLWRVADGQPAGLIAGHTNFVWAVVFSPDGRLLATCSDDHSIRLWDIASGQDVGALEGHGHGVWSLAFSPDGRTLASSGQDGAIRLWDLASRQTVRTLQGQAQGVRSLAFSPDGTFLASGGRDRTVCVWDLDDGRRRHTLYGHADAIWSLAISPDGRGLASASLDGTVRLWDIPTARLRHVLRGHADAVTAASFSPDGDLLVSAGADQTVRLWDAATGRVRNILRGHTDRVMAVAVSPDGQTLASGGNDRTVRLWNSRGPHARQTLRGHTQGICAVRFGPDGETLASAGEDHLVRLWDLRTARICSCLPGHASIVDALAVRPDGAMLASGGADHLIRLWDVQAGQLHRTLRGHTDWVRSVAFSPNGEVLASGSSDQTVRLWDGQTGALLATLAGHDFWVWAVAFSPDGRLVASGSADQTIRLWDARSGDSLQTLSGHGDWVMSVAFSPDGQRLVSCGADHTVRLWDAGAGRLRQILRGHGDWVWSVAFSPDGETIASGGSDHLVYLWDIGAAQVRHVLRGHTDVVRSVAFSASGASIASGSTDETVRLWDVRTGVCLQTLRAEGPYAGMNITGATGLTEAQKTALKALGAVEHR